MLKFRTKITKKGEKGDGLLLFFLCLRHSAPDIDTENGFYAIGKNRDHLTEVSGMGSLIANRKTCGIARSQRIRRELGNDARTGRRQLGNDQRRLPCVLIPEDKGVLAIRNRKRTTVDPGLGKSDFRRILCSQQPAQTNQAKTKDQFANVHTKEFKKGQSQALPLSFKYRSKGT